MQYHMKTNIMVFAPRENSDQSGNLPSLYQILMHEDSLGPQPLGECTGMTLIRLRGCLLLICANATLNFLLCV